jgi:serine/threonine protein kinase
VKPHNEAGGAQSRSQNGDGHSLLQLDNRRFTYRELEAMTSNFKTVLGRGGFGCVYDGVLPDGTQVAVKLLAESSSQGFREFLTEVINVWWSIADHRWAGNLEFGGTRVCKFVSTLALQAQTLAKIHHKNLVSMVGYCKDGEYMALVYEYMSEGDLEDKLRGACCFIILPKAPNLRSQVVPQPQS